MEQFLSIAMESLEKNWFDFNTSTQNALVQIAGHVMNSKAGIKLSGAYPSYCSYCCSWSFAHKFVSFQTSSPICAFSVASRKSLIS